MNQSRTIQKIKFGLIISTVFISFFSHGQLVIRNDLQRPDIKFPDDIPLGPDDGPILPPVIPDNGGPILPDIIRDRIPLELDIPDDIRDLIDDYGRSNTSMIWPSLPSNNEVQLLTKINSTLSQDIPVNTEVQLSEVILDDTVYGLSQRKMIAANLRHLTSRMDDLFWLNSLDYQITSAQENAKYLQFLCSKMQYHLSFSDSPEMDWFQLDPPPGSTYWPLIEHLDLQKPAYPEGPLFDLTDNLHPVIEREIQNGNLTREEITPDNPWYFLKWDGLWEELSYPFDQNGKLITQYRNQQPSFDTEYRRASTQDIRSKLGIGLILSTTPSILTTWTSDINSLKNQLNAFYLLSGAFVEKIAPKERILQESLLEGEKVLKRQLSTERSILESKIDKVELWRDNLDQDFNSISLKRDELLTVADSIKTLYQKRQSLVYWLEYLHASTMKRTDSIVQWERRHHVLQPDLQNRIEACQDDDDCLIGLEAMKKEVNELFINIIDARYSNSVDFNNYRRFCPELDQLEDQLTKLKDRYLADRQDYQSESKSYMDERGKFIGEYRKIMSWKYSHDKDMEELESQQIPLLLGL